MDKKKGIIIGTVVLLIIIIIGVFALTRKSSDDEQINPNNTIDNTANITDETNITIGEDEPYRVDPRMPSVSIPDIIPDTTLTEEIILEVDWEEPPVVTIYNPDADLNSDGHVDREEWDAWIVAHPEDLNQDLQITDEETLLYETTDEDDDARVDFKPITDVNEYIEKQQQYDEEHQQEYRQNFIDAGMQDVYPDTAELTPEGQAILDHLRETDPNFYIDEEGALHSAAANGTTGKILQ